MTGAHRGFPVVPRWGEPTTGEGNPVIKQSITSNFQGEKETCQPVTARNSPTFGLFLFEFRGN